MKLVSILISMVIQDDSPERIISILSIALITIISLLILSLIKAHKLKARIKELENEK